MKKPEAHSEAPCKIAAFYHFSAVQPEAVERLAEELETEGAARGLKGLIIFASEGINGTICAERREEVTDYLAWVANKLSFPQLEPKWSEADAWPFRKFKVRVRPEIVSLGKPEVQPLTPKSPTHLSPEEWDKAMQEEDVVVLDTRNWYETRIGKFKGALDPDLEEFHEFADYLDQSNLPRDKKFLIYCTGGIRCEKAIVEMHNHGFHDVYQLDGGILNYLAEKPHRNFEGECFVFDYRVAVDQDLRPTNQYRLCPHCGQPADQTLSCLRCDSECVICTTCNEQESLRTCSKNCAHHYAMAPGKKGRGQHQGYRFTLGRQD